MKAWLAVSRTIDRLNEAVGRTVLWLVLATAAIAAGNAFARYAFDVSSNAWLEIQWYFFSAIFLLGAGYTLKHQGHVRVDVLYGRLQPRGQEWVNLLGTLFFLLPFAGLMAWLSWAGFLESARLGEISSDAGGLLRWPVRLLLPLGFGLLGLQGVSQAIKAAARLRGHTLPEDERFEEAV